MTMVMIMAAVAVVMAKYSKCYNRGVHRGFQEYGRQVVDSARFKSGKAMVGSVWVSEK